MVNGYLAVYFLGDDPKRWIGWVNLFAMVLNLIPVVGKLLA
jgi:hypothetical protein